jgi:hypothetical protein
VPCCSYIWCDFAGGATCHAAILLCKQALAAARWRRPPAATTAAGLSGVFNFCWVCAQPLVQIGAGAGGHLFQKGKGMQQAAWYLPSHAQRAKERPQKRALPAATGTNLALSVAWRLQAQGYVARSAYKLQEIQEKHKLIKPGSQVLDLGCHPGAWLQVRQSGRRTILAAAKHCDGAAQEPAHNLCLFPALHAAGCL